MTKALSRPTLALLLLLAPFATVEGQLTPGTWTGYLKPPGAPGSFAVTYAVSGSGDQLAISMSSAMIPEAIPFHDIRHDGNTLTFWWEPGVRVNCTLTRGANGAYTGPCSDGSGGEAGELAMEPPA